MKIERLEAIPIAIPFHHDGPPAGFGGTTWTTCNYLLVRVETTGGLIGYGEAFGYNVIPATKAAIEHTIAPLVVGRNCADIGALMESLKRPLHIFGRSGPVQFGLSGLDMALWDIAGKAAGLPVARLLGGGGRASVPAYASMLRLFDPKHVAAACEKTVAKGFKSIKLHEVAVENVIAARRAAGSGTELMLDVNCAWLEDEAIGVARQLADCRLKWLEEPIWPPENLAALARVRLEGGIPLAAGENVANSFAFRDLAASPALNYLQPSVTKVGGISEFVRIGSLADLAGKRLAPHSPYFGPGLLATLQMASVFPHIEAVEYFGVELETPIFMGVGLPGSNGEIAIPSGPGLGADPDPDVIARYRVN
jgi:L-alanine-DL-glutamate epimerase-like enolase superfamily enzyme